MVFGWGHEVGQFRQGSVWIPHIDCPPHSGVARGSQGALPLITFVLYIAFVYSILSAFSENILNIFGSNIYFRYFGCLRLISFTRKICFPHRIYSINFSLRILKQSNVQRQQNLWSSPQESENKARLQPLPVGTTMEVASLYQPFPFSVWFNAIGNDIFDRRDIQ